MLQNLYVKNLALIEELDMEFTEGLNILTGETGAGKSILMGSIGLALGGKYAADMIREGAESGLVELTFLVQDSQQQKKLQDLGVETEEDQVILSRKISGKRSVSRINGETVQKSRLSDVASLLIDIHGQHEHQSLLQKKNHLEILDSFIGEKAFEKKREIRHCHQEYHRLRRKLEQGSARSANSGRELDLLLYEVKEIEEARITPKEDMELEKTYHKMLHGKRIRDALWETVRYTREGGESAGDALSRGVRSLAAVADLDGEVDSLYQQLVQIEGLLEDFHRDLDHCSHSLEFSPEEFEETEERLNLLNHLKAKYGASVEEILEACRKKKEKIAILKDFDGYLKRLEDKVKETGRILHEKAGELSELRREYAARLEPMIEEGLRDLNFESVVFQISLEEANACTADGIDEAEFLVSLNPGQSPKPLIRVASGGELSRLMLVIKTITARKGQTDTLIFDEIDVGISGRTAQKVSEKMAVIGKHHQVLCVTHLAQIAAMADTHFRITKTTKEDSVKTQISRLEETEQVEELARILGGAKITEAVRKNASEMKELAFQIKSDI